MLRATVRAFVLTVMATAAWFIVNEAVKPGYTYNVWINVDELANALLYGDNETISERWGRAELEGSALAAAACDVLDFFFDEPDHCVNSLGE